MIASFLFLALQASPTETRPVAVRTAADTCVEMQGGGVAMIGDRRLRDRALARAVADSLPAGRPLFIRFANERAGNDASGMATVMAGAINAPEIVIVQTCELPSGNPTQ